MYLRAGSFKKNELTSRTNELTQHWKLRLAIIVNPIS